MTNKRASQKITAALKTVDRKTSANRVPDKTCQ